MLRLRHARRLQPLAAASSAAGLLEATRLGGPPRCEHSTRHYWNAQEAQRPADDDGEFRHSRHHRDGEFRGSRHRDGEFRRQHRPPAPIDEPRTLADYNRLMIHLSRRRKAFLMRDVVEEMRLNGVRPDAATYFSGLFSAMKSRKLGDAMYFWQARRGWRIVLRCCFQRLSDKTLRMEMKRHGFRPGVRDYTAIISACGRCGQVQAAIDLRAEMEAAGVELNRHTYLALLNTFSEAGRLQAAREVFDEMSQRYRPDEFSYAALINCYRHLRRRQVPADADRQLLALLEDARAAMAGHGGGGGGGEEDAEEAALWAQLDEEREREGGRQGTGYNGLGLITYNAVLNSLSELGYHQQTLELFEAMRSGSEGVEPDVTTYMNVVRSHLRQALGVDAQPTGDTLTAMIEERLQDVDLAPYVAEIRVEDRLAKAHELGWAAAAALDEDEEEEGPGPAAALAPAAEAAEASEAAGAAEGAGAAAEPVAAGAGEPGAAGAGGERRRAWRRRGGKSEEEALHLYQEVLDLGMRWGPDITYGMLRASLDMGAAGVEDGLAVGHTLLDNFERCGMFVDVGTGTEMMVLAVRRDVGDLSIAHRLWDMMRRSRRVPKTSAAHKYLRALAQREPDAHARIADVCAAILADPDRRGGVGRGAAWRWASEGGRRRSDSVTRTKAEAAARRAALPPPFNGLPAPEQSAAQ
eukprot:scaffold6.g2584.t1